MSRPTDTADALSRADDLRATARRLVEHGLGPPEAANLTAYLYGLPPVAGGWTVDELERLLFVRHLVDTERLRS